MLKLIDTGMKPEKEEALRTWYNGLSFKAQGFVQEVMNNAYAQGAFDLKELETKTHE